MCDILNSFFTSVSTDEDTSNIPIPRQMCEATLSLTFIFTAEMFTKKFASVKNGVSGPDKITTQVLS